MYFRTNHRLGDPPNCDAAAHNLERLESSIKIFNKESAKTISDPARLKKIGALVTADAQNLIDRLSDFVDGGCCDAELRTLEAQVRALPWIFQRSKGTKIVRVEVYRDISRAQANLSKAIKDAQRTASSHSICAPAPTPDSPGGQPESVRFRR